FKLSYIEGFTGCYGFDLKQTSFSKGSGLNQPFSSLNLLVDGFKLKLGCSQQFLVEKNLCIVRSYSQSYVILNFLCILYSSLPVRFIFLDCVANCKPLKNRDT